MRLSCHFFIFSLFCSTVLVAQDLKYYSYDTDLLPPAFHTGRREAVRMQMPDSSMAILFSNPERNRSNDNDYPYHQDPNFYYLTGFNEPNSVLIIFKEKQTIGSVTTSEILFVEEKNPGQEQWKGRKAGPEGAKLISGIETVLPSRAFENTLIPYSAFKQVLYIRLPKGVVDDRKDPADLYNLVEAFRSASRLPANNTDDFRLGKIINSLREVKQPDELRLLKKSIQISGIAHREMMKGTRPGTTEYQVQAIGEYFFKSQGAEEVGYPSICGGGENSCILHYENNRRTLTAKDVLLLDMGAEYHGYSSDITRTLPVSGKFSVEQKAIYQIVFEAQEAAFRNCSPGSAFRAPHQAAAAVISKGLMDLGILQEGQETGNYFMHGTSHYLGLDVHDVGTYGNLKAGNVITVEPGIYIPEGSPCDPKWWNIGVRIEDDILITETGYENLSVSLPRRWEEIEAVMAEPSIFNKKEGINQKK